MSIEAKEFFEQHDFDEGFSEGWDAGFLGGYTEARLKYLREGFESAIAGLGYKIAHESEIKDEGCPGCKKRNSESED